MSEKIEVDQDYEDDDQVCANSSAVELPEHQYTKQELVKIADSPASRQRPPCLDRIYDTKEGKWDPEQWWWAKFGSRENSPLTLVDGKERRRIVDLDRDPKKRTSVNDPVERLKEERDGIVLSPQRRSFVTGCHVQTPSISYSRQLSLPERDREEPRAERDRDRDRDRGERERPLRKIGSGRIQIDRETSRDFSNLRDRFDDRERDRDHSWRERGDRDRDWERDRDPRDSDWDRERDRDRRFERDRSDRFRRVSDNQYPERDRTRERDFRDRDRDRGFDRSGRRRNNYSREEEKEPEWFTGGPTSQTDTIELRGFDNDTQKTVPGERNSRNAQEDEDIQTDKLEKESTENDDCFLPEPANVDHSGGDDAQESKGSQGHLVSHPPKEQQQQQQQNWSLAPQQQSLRLSPSIAGADKLFDLEEILKAHLPLSEEGEVQGSRFSRFFAGPSGNMTDSRASSLEDILMPHREDILMPHDLLEENMPKQKTPLSSSHISSSSMETLHRNLVQTASSHNTDTSNSIYPSPGYSYPIPHSAGDNNGGMLKSALSAPVTALFNSAMAGGANASLSSNGSFSSQDAEAQLKAMLFGGGHRDSASSSGTASPASLRPNSSRRIKTLAEVEADMHQSSPTKMVSPDPGRNVLSGKQQNGGDLAAFNKLLTLISAASDTGQSTSSNPLVSSESSSHGYISSNNEFAHALKRNKEHQMMLQQSAQPQPPIQGQRLVGPGGSMHGLPVGRHPYVDGVYATQKIENVVVPPQAASTPVVQQNPTNKPRLQALGVTASNDPIYSLIQQNPAIVMKPAPPSPSFSMATLLTSQQSIAATNARIPSPLIFSQQPPLHLSAPSPINPSQLVPGTHHVNAAPHPSSSGIVSPVQGVLSPPNMAMHPQAVMQNALIKKHLQNQNEQFVKKQLERAKSPSQQQHITVVKSQPAAQLVLPPNPQPKGATLDTFTPTSVLRKMHSDRAIEKEKQSHEADKEEALDYIHPVQPAVDERQSNSDSLSMDTEALEVKGLEEGNELSFLNPVNPNLVSLSNQLENTLKLNTGQINILPGSLSQPMSVEEKMKLSSLVEKRDNLSQILESKAPPEVAKVGIKIAGMPGRPIVRGADQVRDEAAAHHQYHRQNLVLQQQQQLLQQQPQQQPPQPPPPPQIVQYTQRARAVTGGGGMTVQGSYGGLGPTPPPVPPPPLSQPNLKGGTAGRAIVGSSSIQQQQQHPPPHPPPLGLPPGPPPPVGATLTPDIMRLIEQQKQHQQLQQHYQQAQPVPQGSMAVPPPMVGPIAFGASHVGVPMNTRMPFAGVPVHSNASAALMHQHISRANAISPQRNQYMTMMALQQAQTQGARPLAPVGNAGGASPIPSSQTMGAVSPAALSATIQRVASPCGNIKMSKSVPF